MAKTRSQTGNITIKKEEEEDCKSTLRLNGVTKTTRNKIAKRRPSRNKNNLPMQPVKVEEDPDTKSLLKTASNNSKRAKGKQISQEQINRLIDAIVNDKMSVRKAALKAKISPNTASYYYNVYKNDPDKKIPLPRNQCLQSKANYTQEQIDNLIRYIKKDKMSVPQASAKANMCYSSGRKYYCRYLKDPNHAIPTPPSRKYYTQDQKNDFIGYIINNKMGIKAASKKANVSDSSASSYYYQYSKDHKREFYATNYIIDGKMSIAAASRKANISYPSGWNYYRQYLNDNNFDVPIRKSITQDKINELIGYIVDDKMSIKAASKKANMSDMTASKYYRKYLNNQNQ